mmetsp:Transcript_69233/g.122466  ORF Transcript_69233/g.122466 Transcript_69233/m.122466 type:complete len:277 (-) Transcript_69233:41-871(-)|eukprot:CAMPEP_0197663910 /NCGR_PEP_ID=MMETSP1338-20131121/58316_1 /TAXON_ID=43686 ORGANISM="Pelagodinium beii, Strain RCC1491" /NCGR_SAMPLE_ID=MMETSP1338 /ASSEMBLY_ACC=CAM_ASM_000754 /LENGTH=276 /DNA_ID=CAMNT_0043242439 /DNA_START=77 /DNA_END=907 /DNA_ORIENTATION=-
MGQDLAKECGCGLEASDDVAEDQRLQKEQQAAAKTAAGASAASKSAAPAKATWQDDEQEGFFVPPPPDSGGKTSPGAAPSSPAKVSAPASSSASRPPSSPTQAPPGTASFEDVLADLEGAEQAAYTAAFKSLAAGQASLTPDHEQLRNFVLLNSGVGEGDLDTELLKIASTSESFSIDADSFVMLLRTNAVSDSEALEVFVSMSADGETVSAEDCRNGLFSMLSSSSLGDSLPADRSERIIDTVMTDAGLTVNMEQWLGYSKTAGRIVRLASYAKV